MTAHPVTVRQARRDMRWSVQQADTTAEQQRRRHQQIARLIERAEIEPAPLFGTAPWSRLRAR